MRFTRFERAARPLQVLLLTLLATGFARAATAPNGDGRFHNKLVRAEPAVEGTVRVSPATIRLWFAEPCEVGLSGLKLLDSSGAEVPLGKVAATDDPRSFTAPVSGKLAAGRYQVDYKTSGHDGHAIRGDFWFTVAK